MIQSSLEFVVSRLNDYLMRMLLPKPTKELVVFSVVADQNGESGVKNENGLILSVQNIQEEKKGGSALRRLDQKLPLELSLFSMISGHFAPKLTGESFGLLGLVIGFFHENPVFSPEQFSGFPPGVRQMTWELQNLDFAELSHLWGTIGAKYMPSVVYKVRLQLEPQAIFKVEVPMVSERLSES